MSSLSLNIFPMRVGLSFLFSGCVVSIFKMVAVIVQIIKKKTDRMSI